MARSRKKRSIIEQIKEYAVLVGSRRLMIFGAIFAIAAVLTVIFSVSAVSHKKEEPVAEETEAVKETEPETMSEQEFSELVDSMKSEKEIRKYGSFGIADVSGYINLRSEPDSITMANIIGKLYDGAALDILEENGDWLYVRSGDLTGFVNSKYILTGEEAFKKSLGMVCGRAVIDEEVLNIRSAPEINEENVIGKARNGERYRIIEETGDWLKIEFDSANGTEAYINKSDDSFLHIKECFDEARTLDMREMALTQYDDLVVAYTDGYINVRKEPKEDGIKNICGKFMKGSGAELLDTVTENGSRWYKIKSGKVQGYVSAKYCVTGKNAKDIALDYSTLTAYVKTEKLNVRSKPNTESKIWTQVTEGQAYPVIDQIDGWVEIELDSLDDSGNADHAYISTRDNNVEVRFGLPEAIEYYPAVEAANAAAAYRNKIVNYACQFVGNPYVWGGTSLTKGCDCSGFVLSVFKHFGISVPRTSVNQAKAGKKITSKTMRPGDLIFYANSAGTVNHVGIYIGNGQVVNAASKRSGIKIYRWNYRTPVAIRNIIGN